MTANDPVATPPAPRREQTTAPGGASCRVRRSYGPSYAPGPAPDGGDGPVGPRARALGDQPGTGHQGVPAAVEEAPGPAPLEKPRAGTPAFPDRTPRRRARNPTERTHKMTTRLSDTEKAEITAAARHHAVTVAGFLASAGLAAARGSATAYPDQQLDAAIDELVALRIAISRVGNNINQIAYIYNSGGRPRPGELDLALRMLKRVLARIDAAADALVRRRN